MNGAHIFTWNNMSINVTFTFMGRLGNLMFQVAAIESYCRKNGFTPRYFHTNVTIKYGNSILSKVKWEDPSSIVKFTDVSHPHFEYSPLPLVRENTRFTSPTYFQSEKYFDESVARELFTAPESVKQSILDRYPDIHNCIAIHIRRGDYLSYPDCHPVCSVEYYSKAVKLFPNEKFLVFSDDHTWCKRHLNFINWSPAIGKSDEDELCMMSMCKGNIIANSTFSWWGAYLNETKGKVVVAPSKWFGPRYSSINTNDLIPPTWTIL